MHDFSPASLIAAFGTMLRLDRLSDVTVLLLGILVGLIAKNLYSMAMRSFGFVGGFASRLLVGWWEEFRRETPNVVDFAMAIVSPFDGHDVLLMDPLIGPRRLNDVYLNPRTAFGVRMQTFSITEDRPWVTFKLDDKRGLAARMASIRRRLVYGAGVDGLSPVERLRLKYRRVYAPIETLVGQYLTNEWAAQMAIGEPCHVFRYVVALVYEKNANRYVDRHFHALVIWEELLRHDAVDKVINYHPEHGHRWETIQRIGEHYRSSPDAAAEFGSLHVMIPKRTLLRTYEIVWAANLGGELVPVSRPTLNADHFAAHLAAFGGRPPPPAGR